MAQLDRIFGKTIGTNFTGCIEWTASLDTKGYGKLRFGEKIIGAHRVLYELLIGPIPPGLLLMHSCDNPKCVNVFHLSPGNQKQNMEDCSVKGRTARGAGHGFGKRTHCFEGHEYSEKNTRISSTGARCCRECERLRGIERRRATQ